MADDLLATVPFKRVSHVPIDADTALIVQGSTVGGRTFTLTCIRDAPHPGLALIVAPGPGETETLVLRVGLSTLVGRLAEQAVQSRAPMDAALDAGLDVVRAALADMTLDTVEGPVRPLDLFGPILANMAEWGQRYAVQQRAEAGGGGGDDVKGEKDG